VTRLRSGMSKMTVSSTTQKYKSIDVVMQEDFIRLKERINAAFVQLMKLHEETINRDSVLAELLLDTQMGKNNRMICKAKTNEQLQLFFATLQEDFIPPDIKLTYALPIHRHTESFGGSRKSSGSRRRSSSRKRSKS
jgi:hypothetical protein